MTDLASLRARLRHIAAHQQSAHSTAHRAPRTLPAHWPVRVESTPRGECYLLEQSFRLEHLHGRRPLGAFVDASLPEAAFIGIRPRGPQGEMAFVDTETTGLAGGAGTIAFLIGIGRFEAQRFLLRQYFLRDPAEEAAMLQAALANLRTASALVTFNGRAFDVPILEARATLRLRQIDVLGQVPHLDLLAHARRFWRDRLPSCALSSLEANALGITRSQQDVESALIPELYRQYLEQGEGGILDGVIYHNACDILSLVALAQDVFARYRQSPDSLEDPHDGLALGRLYANRGDTAQAEASLRSTLRGETAAEIRVRALRDLSLLLKRSGRSPEAVPLWEDWHRLAPRDLTPGLELAKHFEWRERDYSRAIYWAERADEAARRLPAPWARRQAEAEIKYRLERLRRKDAQD